MGVGGMNEVNKTVSLVLGGAKIYRTVEKSKVPPNPESSKTRSNDTGVNRVGRFRTINVVAVSGISADSGNGCCGGGGPTIAGGQELDRGECIGFSRCTAGFGKCRKLFFTTWLGVGGSTDKLADGTINCDHEKG